LLGLLVTQHLLLHHLLHLSIVQATVADGVDLVADDNQEVVAVVATLIHLGNFALLGLEEPLHGIARRANAGQIVLAGGDILGLEHLVTALGSILGNVGSSEVGTGKSAELIEDSATGGLGIVYFLLHNGSRVLVDHILAVKHLNNEVTL